MSDTRFPGDDPASQDVLVRAFIHDRFVDMFLAQNRRAQTGLLLAATTIAFVWYGRTQSDVAVAWLALAGVVSVSRFVFTERFVRAAAPSRQAARIAGVLALNGVMMAIPLVAFDHFNAVERAAVSIVLLATATASAATTAGYRDVFLAFALPMLVPLAVVWVVSGADVTGRTGSWGLGLLILAFLGFLVSIGRQVNQVFEDASRYRHGEQQLTRELQQALEQADELNRAKTRFLAAASHDLRQPIHGITVLVAALGLRALDPRSREIVGHLDSVNQLLSAQLDSLLDISRLDAGIVEPELGLHALDGLVRVQAEALAPVAAAKGIRLVLGQVDRIVARTDPALLGRVLGNLADNALKFTPAGGRIELSVVRDGDRARLGVADTGIGIPAAEHDKVFREFYQVGNAGRDRAKGLGLGLSIVRRLSDLLGVSLALDSREGAGTVVTVSLPALPDGGAPSPSRGADRSAAPMPLNRAVLVVDDEALIRRSMEILLSQLGCEVCVAATAADALALARTRSFDLVLSDLRLGDADDGVQLVRDVQALQPGCRAALITGDTAPARMVAARDAGIALLYKPVTLTTLRDVIGADDAPREAR